MLASHWIDGPELDAAIVGILEAASGPLTPGQIARADRLELRATASARSAALRRLEADGRIKLVPKWDGSLWRWVDGYAVSMAVAIEAE